MDQAIKDGIAQGWVRKLGVPIFNRDLSGDQGRRSAFIKYGTGPRAAALLSVSREWWHEPGCIRCCYEDLVHNPVGELRQLVKSLNHPVSDDVIEAAIEANSLERLRHTSKNKHFWQGKPGLWRSLIPAPQARRIERSLSASLREFGYECDPDDGLDAVQADANWFQLY